MSCHGRFAAVLTSNGMVDFEDTETGEVHFSLPAATTTILTADTLVRYLDCQHCEVVDANVN